jgi:hypothetical protein
MRRNCFGTLLALPLLLLVGCSEPPKKAEKKKEPEKPPEPITARSAFQQIFASARTWAPDAQILRIANIRVEGVKDQGGKCGAWQAILVSPSRARQKMFTYSVVEGPGNLHKGVFGTPDEPYTQRGQAKPFLIAALKVDSDQAFETAMKKGADYAKKHPDMPVSFLLELTPQNQNPTWRILWGESVSTSNYSIVIDASTGEYLRTLR